MRKITFSQATQEAMAETMAKDPTVFAMGEDLARQGGIFGQFKGLPQQFPGRIIDTPISETFIIGGGVGAALAGARPVVDMHFADFIGVPMDEIFNQMAKVRYMFGGQAKVPLVLRAPDGSAGGGAAQHSQCVESWFAHIPGIKVVAPSNPYDAKMVLKAAIECDDAGLYFAAVALFGRGGVFQMVLHAIDVLRSNVAGSAFRRNIQLTQRLQKILGRYAKFCRKVFHLGLVFSHALISLTLPPACAEPPEFFPAGRFRAYIPAASGLGLALIDQKFPPLRGQNVAHELLFGHAPSAYGAHPGGHMPPVHAIRLPRPPFRRPCPHRHRPCQPIRPLRERGS